MAGTGNEKRAHVMMSDRWRRIEELYHSAVEREGEERTAFLNEVCAGDEVLRRELESLLACDGEPEAFAERRWRSR
jgi:hypothetical protein